MIFRRVQRILFLSLFCFAFEAKAFNLAQVYDLAVNNDPTLQAAFASLQANRQAVPEALAQMFPNISANYITTGTDTNIPFFGNYNTKNYAISLTQPIYHPEHWAQLEQARHVVKGASASYVAAAQELIIRVANQYFSILAATDDYDFTKSQRIAFARELEQTQQRFEVGLIAITDVQDAKARHDTAVANEIAAANAVLDQYEKLREIIGVKVQEVTLFPITKPLSLVTPIPNDQEKWVESSHLNNLTVIAAKEAAEQQKAIIGAQVSGHFPKFDLQAQLQHQKGAPPFPFDELVFNRSLSLQVAIPIFSGGGVIFRTQEARARYDEAMKRLEAEQRSADSQTRQAYRGVLTAIGRVTALAQAVLSNKTALEATRAAYEVGTRTMVDVLNSETSLLGAQREHSKERYNYILQGLKLKQAAGTLTSQDIMEVNAIILNPGK